MKTGEAIGIINDLKPGNGYEQSTMIRWLDELEAQIIEDVIMTHEGEAPFPGGCEGSLERELLVQSPYDDIYIKWLESKIDYYNGEIERYNNALGSFYAVYDKFKRKYNQTHMPKTAKLTYY